MEVMVIKFAVVAALKGHPVEGVVGTIMPPDWPDSGTLYGLGGTL